VLQRSPSVLEPWTDRGESTTKPEPQSSLVAIHEDADGFLWVILQVPDPLWRASLEPLRTPEGTVIGSKDRGKTYDSIVEVIDVDRHTVVASARLDMELHGFAGDGYVFGFSESPTPTVKIWHMRRAHQ
jgi:hypothetical protein